MRRLALVLAAISLAVTAPVSARSTTECTPQPVWGTGRADLAAEVVQLVNQHRASLGLAQLAVSAPLTASSTWKSLHMVGSGYFAHDDPAPPVSRTAYQRALACGYSGWHWGENIAFGQTSAQAVMSGWLASPGHRANIEGPSFTSIGVGVAPSASGQLYWTQNFGDDVAAAPPATPPPPTAAAGSGAAPSRSTSAVVGARPARVRRVGSRLVAEVAFVRLATGKPFVGADVRCRAELGGRRVQVVTNAFRDGRARCAWRLPANAVGRVLTGVVAVQVGGVAVPHVFVRRL